MIRYREMVLTIRTEKLRKELLQSVQPSAAEACNKRLNESLAGMAWDSMVLP